MDRQTEILVVGAGAIGVYFGGRLAQAGARVSVVARSDAKALAANGGVYKIKSINGDFEFRPERILSSAAECPVKPDYLIVSLKVLPGVDPVELARPAVGPGTVIVVLQNGIGNEDCFAAAFPGNEIIGVIAYIGASRPAPGEVLHQDVCKLTLGRFPKGPSERASALSALFNKAKVSCDATDDIVMNRWRKLLWNAPYNPISVIGRNADTRAMSAFPESVELSRKVMEEVAAIAKAEGCELPYEAIEANLSLTARMSPYKTSMLQDYEAGRPLEIEAILGNPLKIAAKRGVDAPNMRALYALLKLVSRKP